MLTRCQCSQDVLTRRAHTRRTQNATPRRPRCRCAPNSLRLRPCLRPTSSILLSTRSSRLPRCRGRALARLPPAPQLRGPRSTISPRSRPGKLVELDAFCVPSSSPRGRCHSPETRCTFQTSGSVIAAGCRRLPQHGQRRRHRGRVQRRDREDLGERGDLRAARVEQGQERLGWAGLLRAAAAASVIKYNAWLRVLADRQAASVLCRIGYQITKGTT